jgi:protein TonB
MSPSDVISKPIPRQRLLEQQLRRLPSGAGYGLALLSALLLHGAVLSLVYFENWFAPSPVVKTTEIPIEIVAEPPPQEKPDNSAAKPDPPPPAQPIEEEPATDAPRAANHEKIERKAPDEATEIPPAPTPTTEPNPGGAAGAAPPGPARQGEAQSGESAAAPELNKPDAEVVRSAVESELQKAEQAARAHAQAQAPPQLAGAEMSPAWSIGRQSSNFERMLDAEMGSEAEETPVAGGNAKKTYGTILYGMIVPHVHSPAVIRSDSSQVGEVDFVIDGKGNLRERKIVRSSGFPDVDSIWLEAIAQAAPFPPPPGGRSIRPVLTFPGK